MSNIKVIDTILEVNDQICKALISGVTAQLRDHPSDLLEKYLVWAKKKRKMSQALREQALEVAVQIDQLCGELGGGCECDDCAVEIKTKIEVLSQTARIIDEKYRDLELYGPFSILAKSAVHDLTEIIETIMDRRREEQEDPKWVSKFDN